MPVRLWQFIGLAVFLAVLAPGAACGADVASPRASAAPPAAFTLLDGDRVVLLGSTFIERDQSHGYLEAALTSRFHSQKLQFRNLGWSGDTVFGEARAGFGTVADGFENLKRHVLALEPTVILLSYGANESFAGQAELDSFTRGLDVLLATLDETKARIVFIVPPPQEKLSPPLPDPTEHNRDLKRYCKAIAAAAAKRQAPFVDLFALLGPKLEPPAGVPLTDNGLHLTDYGYWRAAPVIEQALSLPPRRWKIEIDVKRQNVFSNGTKLSDVKVAAPPRSAFRRSTSNCRWPRLRRARRRGAWSSPVRAWCASRVCRAVSTSCTSRDTKWEWPPPSNGPAAWRSAPDPISRRSKCCGARSWPRIGSISTAGARRTKLTCSGSANTNKGTTPSRFRNSIRWSPSRKRPSVR